MKIHCPVTKVLIVSEDLIPAIIFSCYQQQSACFPFLHDKPHSWSKIVFWCIFVNQITIRDPNL